MDIEHLSQEWIKAEARDTDSSNYNHWAVDYVIDLPLEGKYDELWNFIRCTYTKEISDKVIEVLAAGPVEDLLANAGENYIEQIGTLSRKDPKFKDLLGGVWQNSMSDSLWGKFCEIRGKAW
jgi:hypothetical protein